MFRIILRALQFINSHPHETVNAILHTEYTNFVCVCVIVVTMFMIIKFKSQEIILKIVLDVA